MRTNVGEKKDDGRRQRRKSHGGQMTNFQLFSGRRYFRKLKFHGKRGGTALTIFRLHNSLKKNANIIGWDLMIVLKSSHENA
jgi:hypothetical protein